MVRRVKVHPAGVSGGIPVDTYNDDGSLKMASTFSLNTEGGIAQYRLVSLKIRSYCQVSARFGACLTYIIFDGDIMLYSPLPPFIESLGWIPAISLLVGMDRLGQSLTLTIQPSVDVGHVELTA